MHLRPSPVRKRILAYLHVDYTAKEMCLVVANIVLILLNKN